MQYIAKISSTESLFVMPIAPTSHHHFLSILAFLETFYMVLIDRKQVLKQSEHFLFFLPLLHTGKIQNGRQFFAFRLRENLKPVFQISFSKTLRGTPCFFKNPKISKLKSP